MSTNLDTIKICSWNLCFGCLDNNINDKQSIHLINECIENSNNNYYCANNIITILNNIKINENIDIYAFQEQSSRKQFRKDLDILFNLTHVRHSKDVEFTNKRNIKVNIRLDTYYHNKFKILKEYSGNLMPNNARPYVILTLEHIDTREIFTFINLHNGHNITVDQLLTIINPKNIDTQLIIMAGDFNDNNTFDYWDKKIRINEKILYANERPPNTRYISPNNAVIGDYIISTSGASNKIFNFDAQILTSDHLPIIGTIVNNSSNLIKCIDRKNDNELFKFLNYDNSNDWYDIPDNFYLKELTIKDFKKIVGKALLKNKKSLSKINSQKNVVGLL